MRFGLRFLQACVLLASAAVAAFADTPSRSAASGPGTVQEQEAVVWMLTVKLLPPAGACNKAGPTE